MAALDPHGLTVAVLTTDRLEQLELTRPVKAVRRHGAQVEIIAVVRTVAPSLRSLRPAGGDGSEPQEESWLSIS